MVVDLPLYPPRVPSPADRGATVWNWAQNTALGRADTVSRPGSEDEVRSLVAGRTGRIRVVGSRMSSGRMLRPATPGDVLLDVGRLRGVLATTEDTATFAGGTPLHEVYSVLSAMGRTPSSSPGVIADQTLAGALATGTHGQGLQQSSIGDGATSIRMVLADGSVQSFDADHPAFGAVQLGLGVLGVVTAVTLRTRPALAYTCHKDAVSAGTLEDDLPGWNTDHAFSKAWWFPDDDTVHLWTAREATDEEDRAYRAGGADLLVRDRTSDAMNGVVDRTVALMQRDTGIADADGRPFRTVTRFKDFSDVTGDVYQVFCRGIATPQINVEIGVPLQAAGEVIRALKRWHRATRPHLHYPIIMRCTGPSTSWLSPAAGRPTCFFGLVVYYAEDGSLPGEGAAFLRAAEELLAAHGGRPHWGKYFDEALYDWPRLYPRWEDFRRVREELDPHRTFTNAFTTRLFGDPRADGDGAVAS